MMLFDGLDVGTLKWPEGACGLNLVVHGGMKDISNVNIHCEGQGLAISWHLLDNLSV